MMFEVHRNPRGAGGFSVHHLWPFELRLIWNTDWELRYLPPAFEILAIVTMVLMFLDLGLLLTHPH